MVLKGFEDRLERLVEGVFTRAFKSGLQPVEIARRLIREIDTNRTVDVSGNTLAPNRFTITVSEEDFQQFSQINHSLISELAAAVRQHAKDKKLNFVGRVSIEMESVVAMRVGELRVESSFDELVADREPDAWLEGPGGEEYKIRGVAKIGRVAESNVIIDDANISRNHAEIHPAGDNYQLVDLGSTNGCKVNGKIVNRQNLVDGDELQFGPVKLKFRRP